jgi:hypothetical protein
MRVAPIVLAMGLVALAMMALPAASASPPCGPLDAHSLVGCVRDTAYCATPSEIYQDGNGNIVIVYPC